MSESMKHFFRYQFPAIGWGLLIFFASSIPSTKIPSFFLFSFDKLVHFFIFFIFCLLVYRAFEPRNHIPLFSFKRVFIAFGLITLYGAIDEIHQGFVPGRTFDLRDLCADAAGGIAAGILIYFFYRRKIRLNNSVSP